MSVARCYSDEAKQRVAEAIGDVEAGTSAELVVAVRTSSGRYRETDYLVGVAVALAAS